MPEIGQTISHYRIIEKIGQGGMGEVYLADDKTLDRKVALKFLPDAFTSDPERMARFEREAKLLASLNHPNIAGIYGLEQAEGTRFLVLEYVEGETLKERLSESALPLEDALVICRQIAEGLEAAHENGVIHRDLKPANVTVTAEEKVKILDFGLAKAFAEETQTLDSSQSPTLTEAMTRPGMILGTAAYMSPEQAKGKSVDKRADIWAFGCILYECLTGKKAFEGETVTETLAAILRGDPDWNALRGTIPSCIQTLLHRCLHKDKKMRIHDAADVRIELEEAFSTPPTEPTEDSKSYPRWKPSLVLPWVLAALLLGIVIWIYIYQRSDATSDIKTPIRLSIILPKGLILGGIPVLSPNGSNIVFAAAKDGISQLYIRSLEEENIHPIEGTEGAEVAPFFSPDGKRIAFLAEGMIKIVSVKGGSPLTLTKAYFMGGAWCRDGTIIYSPSYDSGLWRIPVNGGNPEKLTVPDPSRGELGHWWPQLLPDEETVLFTNYATPFEKCSISTYSLKTHKQTILLSAAMYGRYAPSGHLVFIRSGTLLAATFDWRHLSLIGDPFPVLDDLLGVSAAGYAAVSFSENGILAYMRMSSIQEKHRLVRFDRNGNISPIDTDNKLCNTPRFSPDGKRIAMTCIEPGKSSDIWTYDIQRGTLTKITQGNENNSDPLWASEGKKLIYQSERPQYDLYWKKSDGADVEEPLLSNPRDKILGTISNDGTTLIYSEKDPQSGIDLWYIRLDNEPKPERWLHTPSNETSPSLSPDGHWLAYVSDESGRREVYIQPFPEHGERIQVTTDGGDVPIWSPKKDMELFYIFGTKIMGVPIIQGKGLEIGTPSTVFDLNTSGGYDVSPDGTWFVGLQRDPTAPPDDIEVILNWFEDLKKKVPVN